MARTERFLATGSRLVVQPTKPGSTPVWYVTKKDVPLPDGEFNVVVCPLTGAAVNRAVIDGKFAVHFPSRMVRARIVLDAGDVDDEKLKAFRPVQFSYYIPDSARDPDDPTGKRGFPNPSDELRRFAIRTDDGGSVWLMNEGDVPLPLMGKMLDAGAVPFVVRLHPDDARAHIVAGIMALQRQIVAATVSAAESQAHADAQLATATAADPETGKATKTAEKAEKYYANRAKGIAKRLTELSADLVTAATRFGIDPTILGVGRLADTATTISDRMADRAKAYLTAARALRDTGTTDGVALANAAEAQTILVEPMIDALREAGNEAGADALQTAFADEPAKPATDDGTFSLTDADAAV